jgi:hypothetical protein
VKEEPPQARVAVLTASTGEQISGSAPSGAGGLLTSFLLKGLANGEADLDGDSQVSLQELVDYVKPRVAREALKDHRDQTPTLTLGNGLGAPSDFILEWGLAPR